MKQVKAIPKLVFDKNFTDKEFKYYDYACFISILDIDNNEQKFDKSIGNFLQVKMWDKNDKGWYGFINTKLAAETLEGYDVVFCMEADMLITNPSVKLEQFIDNDNHFFLCKDVNGWNGGSFIVRNTPEAKEWLSFVNSCEDGYGHEQNVFEIYCDSKSGIKQLPHPSINSIKFDEYFPAYGKPNYKEGDIVPKPKLEQGDWEPLCLLCHLPAMPLEKRIETFKKLIKDYNL